MRATLLGHHRRRRGPERRDIHIAYQPTLRDKFAAGAAILECPTWSSFYGLPLTTKLCLPAPLYCWTRCIEASYFFLRKRMIRWKRFARSKSNIVIGRCRTFAAEYLEIELAKRQELLQLPLQLRLLLPFPPPCCVRDKMNTSDLNRRLNRCEHGFYRPPILHFYAGQSDLT